MNKTTLLVTLVLSTSVFAGIKSNKVIYGEDNRLDVFESTESMYVELSESTAAQISKKAIKSVSNGEFIIKGDSLHERGICKSERFSHQSSVANCSGFLVGENLLVTAGHCMRSMRDCEKSDWVFDYKVEDKDQTTVKVSKSSVYSCKKIISQDLVARRGNDYALIELDRKVIDRKPLETRKKGKIKKGDKLVVIGHPSGLPTKIADGASVRSLKRHYFIADLDTYGGNSGSAVFNASTGMVEGILVRGETDYLRRGGCRASNVIDQDAGRGEDVTYITNIKELL